MLEVRISGDAQPVTLAVRFDPARTTIEALGHAAEHALETDPRNTAPVEVVFERA